MPIIVQALKDASYQDQQDLQKIYRDAPEWLLAPFSGEAELIESILPHPTMSEAMHEAVLAAYERALHS